MSTLNPRFAHSVSHSRHDVPSHGIANHPWDSPASGWDALTTVHSWRGTKNDTDMKWVPGVVVALVYTAEGIAQAIEDLQEALGPSGTTQGVLFMAPDLRNAERPSNAALAMRRMRVVWPQPKVQMTDPLTVPMRKSADEFLLGMGRRTGDRFRSKGFRLPKSPT